MCPRVNVAAAGPGDGPTPHLVWFVCRSVARCRCWRVEIDPERHCTW